MEINEDRFPSKEEFYKTIMKLKMQRERKREGIYLGYLKGQRAKKKSRNSKSNTKVKDRSRY